MTLRPLFFPLCLAALALGAALTPARAALLHRFSFSESAVKDSVGQVTGTLKGAGASVIGGKLFLANDASLSGDKISHLEFSAPVLPKAGKTVSIVVWFSASNAGEFSRVINFGASEGTEGIQFIYFAPRIVDGMARIAITGSDVGSKTNIDPDALDDGTPHMVAIVIDGAAEELRVYIDGKQAREPMRLGANTLDKVKPVENWLGRSSFAADPGFTGSIDELRVYDHALTQPEAAALQAAGPNALPPVQPAKK